MLLVTVLANHKVPEIKPIDLSLAQYICLLLGDIAQIENITFNVKFSIIF